MKARFTFTSREDKMIGLLFINRSNNIEAIAETDNTINVKVTKIDVNELLIIKFFANPINVEIIE